MNSASDSLPEVENLSKSSSSTSHTPFGVQSLKGTPLAEDVTAALNSADKLCNSRQVKLTQLRRQVLTLIWNHRKPLGAYLLMDLLKEQSDRDHVAPPTVYRSLDFLLEQGLIYKIHCLNAFVACTHPGASKCDALFICKHCGHTDEVPSNTMQQAINLSASQQRFTVSRQMIEVTGVCAGCRR